MIEAPAIVLVGPPAVGKSTVGALLADRLGLGFCDVDAVIEAQQARPITEIFAELGEAAFRRLELEATLAALSSGGVVALGGGAVTNAELRAALADHQVIWLRTTVYEAVRRVGESTTRPLLNGDVAGKWSRLVAERAPYYEQVATIVINSGRRSPAKVAAEIAAKILPEESR